MSSLFSFLFRNQWGFWTLRGDFSLEFDRLLKMNTRFMQLSCQSSEKIAGIMIRGCYSPYFKPEEVDSPDHYTITFNFRRREYFEDFLTSCDPELRALFINKHNVMEYDNSYPVYFFKILVKNPRYILPILQTVSNVIKPMDASFLQHVHKLIYINSVRENFFFNFTQFKGPELTQNQKDLVIGSCRPFFDQVKLEHPKIILFLFDLIYGGLIYENRDYPFRKETLDEAKKILALLDKDSTYCDSLAGPKVAKSSLVNFVFDMLRAFADSYEESHRQIHIYTPPTMEEPSTLLSCPTLGIYLLAKMGGENMICLHLFFAKGVPSSLFDTISSARWIFDRSLCGSRINVYFYDEQKLKNCLTDLKEYLLSNTKLNPREINNSLDSIQQLYELRASTPPAFGKGDGPGRIPS